MKDRPVHLNVILVVLTWLVLTLAAWNDTHLWMKLVLYICGFALIWWLFNGGGKSKR